MSAPTALHQPFMPATPRREPSGRRPPEAAQIGPLPRRSGTDDESPVDDKQEKRKTGKDGLIARRLGARKGDREHQKVRQRRRRAEEEAFARIDDAPERAAQEGVGQQARD